MSGSLCRVKLNCRLMPIVGSEISTDVALQGLQPVPQEVTSEVPELQHLMYARAGSKVLLVNPRLGLVLAVLD